MSQKSMRRNYFIKRNFQGKMILGLFLFVIGSIILFTVILGMFSADSMTMSYKNSSLQLDQTPVMLYKNALAASLLGIVFGGSLLVIAALLLSHRIAGPQVHLEKALKSMIDGDLTDTIYLRTKDVGRSLATHINSFNSSLSKKIHEVDKHSQSIDELVDLIDQSDASTLNKETILESYHSIRKHTNAIRKVTDSFTLTDE